MHALFSILALILLTGITCVENTAIFQADVFSIVPSVFASVCILYKSTVDCSFSLYLLGFNSLSVKTSS